MTIYYLAAVLNCVATIWLALYAIRWGKRVLATLERIANDTCDVESNTAKLADAVHDRHG